MPTLENPDYYVCPSLPEIRKIAASSKPVIDKFIVGSRKFGKVTFNAPLHVSEIAGLALDKVLVFKEFGLGVYPGKVAPAKGKGLNLPATISFLNISLPRKYAKNVGAFEDKLRAVASSLGPHMSFHSYDPSIGTLKLRAEHLVADQVM